LGSEFSAGWTWAKAAAEVADVVLITDSLSSGLVKDEISELELPITVHSILPEWARALVKTPLMGVPWYCLWMYLAGRVIREYEATEPIAAVHHLTYASDSLPSALVASRAPVRIWGPVGGVTRTKVGLYRYLTLPGILGEIRRDIVNGLFRATSGRWIVNRSTLVVALNHDVERRWRRAKRPIIVESAVALEPGELEHFGSTGRLVADPMRTALFVGRLIPWKGLLVAVSSLVHAPDWKLIVLGEGPDRRRAEALAERIGVRDRLEFRGRVPRSEVLSAFASADALLFPSFHDAASWSAAEASALGCPVVCLDAGGPRLQAGQNAHSVPVDPVSSLPRRIGECLASLRERGVPDDHLLASRIPAILKVWYEI
jgi:glycosyltransferase involved in cell wall biosynthesis